MLYLYNNIRRKSPNNSAKQNSQQLSKLVASMGKKTKVKRVTAFGLFIKRKHSAIQANPDVLGDFSLAEWRSSTCTAFNAFRADRLKEINREANRTIERLNRAKGKR